MIKKEEVLPLIELAFKEDIKDGDHSSLSCIPNNKMGKAQLIVKDQGIIAGIKLAEWIFESIEPTLFMEIKMKDGDKVKKGDIAFTPLVEKYKAKIKVNESKPACSWFTISSKITLVASNVEGGKISLIKVKSSSWKPSIGTKGMSVNKTRIEGKKARKKLKVRDDALVVMAPSTKPL